MGGEEEVKKILGLTIAVVLVIGLVAGGTWAVFSDTETSSPNTFTAGTIDLEVNTENPWTSAAVTTELADLKPCEVGYVSITLKNVGTNELEVWKHIKDVVCAGGTHPESELAEDPDDTINNINEYILYDMWIEVGGDSLEYNPGAGDIMLINESEGLHIYDIECNYMYIDVLAPGASITIVQSYHMESSVTNWAQGDTMTFTIEFVAQQTAGTPDPPGTELAGHGRPTS